MPARHDPLEAPERAAEALETRRRPRPASPQRERERRGGERVVDVVEARQPQPDASRAAGGDEVEHRRRDPFQLDRAADHVERRPLVTAGVAAIGAEMADVGGVVVVRARRSGCSTSSRLRAGARVARARVVDAEANSAARARVARSATSGSSALTTRSVAGSSAATASRQRSATRFELAVTVELVAEEVAERHDPRAHVRRSTGQRGFVDLEQARDRRRGRRGGWRRRRMRGWHPSCSRRAGARSRGSRAAIAVVVVLPFVAETSADCRSRAGPRAHRLHSGRASRAVSRAGSSRHRDRRRATASRPREPPRSPASAVRSRRRAYPPVTRQLSSDDSAEPFWRSCNSFRKLYSDCMARGRRRHPALAGIDEAALAEFRAGLRRRYTDEQILEELRASAARLGRSPTMREFARDPDASVHPQTVIEHFGTWNAAKRAAGLTPRRFISREELLEQLRRSARSSGGCRRRAISRSAGGRWPRSRLIWHTFGSLTAALREAGFDVPVGEERLERAVAAGGRARPVARPAAEDGRLEGGAAERPVADVRVAGVSARRHRFRAVGGVPVPRARASPRGRCRCAAGRDARFRLSSDPPVWRLREARRTVPSIAPFSRPAWPCHTGLAAGLLPH